MWMKACQKSPILSFQTVIMYVLEKREQMKKKCNFLTEVIKGCSL